jgi:hypothetical protein
MQACRLCGGLLKPNFTHKVLDRHAVGYFLCQSCDSLQTEAPYWLSEAYADHNLAVSDTGSAVRSLECQAVIWAAVRIMRLSSTATVLDHGGGIGLLCRLLRDIGFSARVYDAYARNLLATTFDDDGSRPDILCSFEVVEHFAEPAAEMKRLFDRQARMMILGTETYRGQGADWWYIAPHSGQHVFFYSEKAMQFLANNYSYYYTRVGGFHFFLDRPMTRLEASLLWRALSPTGMKWIRAAIAFKQNKAYAIKDSLQLAGSIQRN